MGVAKRCLMLVLASFWIAGAAWAEVAVRATHPRLFLTPERVRELVRDTAPNGPLRAHYDVVAKWADREIERKRLDGGRSTVRLMALMFALTGDRKYLDFAYQVFGAMQGSGDEGDRKVRARLEAAAYLLDWAHDALDAGRRDALRKSLAADTDWLDRFNYLGTDGVVGGHHFHDHKSALLGALALADQDAKAKALVERLRKNLVEHYLPFYAHVAGDDGGFHQGYEYSRYYHEVLVEIMDVWRSATGQDWFKDNAWLAKGALFQLHGLKDDKTFFMTGDGNDPLPTQSNRIFLMKAAQEWGLPQAAWGERLLAEWNIGMGAEHRVMDLLWRRREVAPAPPKELARFFARAGIVTMREKWAVDASDPGVTALFKATPVYFGNHSHRDANSFEIALGGNLALDSGYYDSYKSDHWRYYYTQTVAHNSVVIERAGQLVGQAGDAAESLDEAKSGQFAQAEIAFEDTPLYTYAVGDAARAYPEALMKRFLRHFLFLRVSPRPVIVVFDDVAAVDGAVPVWLLHSDQQPELQRDRFTLSNGRAKLEGRILLPREALLTPVGGTRQRFFANGVNYPPKKDPPPYAGSWRLELRARKGHEQQFLVAMLPQFMQDKPAPAVDALEEPGWHGLRVGATRLLFRTGDDSALAVAAAPQGVERTLLFGLPGGSGWQADGLPPLRASRAGVVTLNGKIPALTLRRTKG